MDIKLLFPIKLSSGITVVIVMFLFEYDIGKKYCNCAVLLSFEKSAFQILLSEFKYRNLFKIKSIH